MTGGRPDRRAVVLDLPGTVLRTEDNAEAHLRLMEAFVEKYRLPDEPAFLLEKFNARIFEPYERLDSGWVSHRDTVVAVLGGLLRERKRDVHAADEEWFYQAYLQKHQSLVRLVPGAGDMLAKCESLKLHVAAVGNMDRDYIEKQLCWLSVMDRFDSVTTPEEAGAPLPDPRMLNLAMERARVEPAQAIFVGDSVWRGIRPAKALGMSTVLLDTAMKQTELAEADFTASSVGRALNIIIELAYRP